MTPCVLLAADCGSGVGLGHLERMLALADALRSEFAVAVVVPAGDTALRRRVIDRGHEALDASGDPARRVDAAVGAVPAVKVVVLDGYVFPVELQPRLRERAPPTVVDDLGLPADCDLAVNPAPGGERLRPDGAAAFLGGAAYALLRGSFVAAREARELRDLAARDVLVSTGATDLDGLGRSISLELLDRDPTVDITVVAGPDSDAVTPGSDARSHVLVAPADLAASLARATVYVGAAGTTAVQAACVGTPAVITAAVPNQTAQAAALGAAGCAVVVDAAALATQCLKILDDPARRALMSARGRALVDGHGAARVAEAIRQLAAARAVS